MLARARHDAPAAQSPSKVLSEECLKARLHAQVAAAHNAEPVDVSQKASSTKAELGELIIDFRSDGDTLPASEILRIKRFQSELKLKAGNKIKLTVARGGFGNMFEQAVIAQRRARVIKELFPARMITSTDFDPQQSEDTVRVEVVDPS
jgi:hypothetical protein